jgi:hypothetical protein
MTSSIRAGYDTRTYNLQAGVPQALPSAREFLIISATVDITTIGFNLGDNNGDFEVWPFGFAIGVTEGSVKARIQSAVTQTVVIAMIDGLATVKDNRFAPGAGSLPVTMIDGANVALGAKADAAATTDAGTFSLIALTKRLLGKTNAADTYGTRFIASSAQGAALNTAIQVTAGANVNGILLSSWTMCCGADPTAFAQLSDSGNTFATCFPDQAMTMGTPIIIPAGNQLSTNTQGLCKINGTYRIL